MSAGIFISGTDTGVGKTAIACGILAALRTKGLRVAPFKPAETGCPAQGWPSDARALAQAAGGGFQREEVVPYALPEPLAPSVAAQRAGIQIDIAVLDAAFEALRSRADLVVVEGAGGIAVPITADVTMADLARRWRLPVLVVARPGLGTINHTVLTIEHARARGLRVLGVVINNFPTVAGVAESTSPAVIARMTGAPILGIVPRIEGLDVEAGTLGPMSRAILDCVDLAPVFELLKGGPSC